MSEVGLLFELPRGGKALFTSRLDGNMSSVGGLDREHGAHARACTRARHGLKSLVRGYQVHGTTVLSIRAEPDLEGYPADEPDRALARSPTEPDGVPVEADGVPTEPDGVPVEADGVPTEPDGVPVEADGHVTCMPGIGVMVMAADCLPIAIGSEHGVAAVHAGWRGLAAGVIEEGVRALLGLQEEEDVGSARYGRTGEGAAGRGGDHEITAIIGPGAGPCCYEVGDEVHAAFGDAHRDGRYIDLKAIARERLTAAGVGDVRDVGLCTICDERFFSYRREASAAGRQAGIAWLVREPRG
jgi:copper oxidase (laccase) domain-containing protein